MVPTPRTIRTLEKGAAPHGLIVVLDEESNFLPRFTDGAAAPPLPPIIDITATTQYVAHAALDFHVIVPPPTSQTVTTIPAGPDDDEGTMRVGPRSAVVLLGGWAAEKEKRLRIDHLA